MILAADIGGTKSLFALFEIQNGELSVVYKKKYKSRQFPSLQEAASVFLAECRELGAGPDVEAACFCLAGPIINGECFMVNLGWTVRMDALRGALPYIPTIYIINDLEAAGHGIPLIAESDLLPISPRRSDDIKNRQVPLNSAVIAPGTGLGEALIIGGKPYPSEGSHCEFGPRSEEEARLWRYMSRKSPHVSYEKILSGPGLVNLTSFLMEENGITELGFALVPEEITFRALEGVCPICRKALHMFTGILGAEAGNLALKVLAYGGIYIGGGIPPKILPKLKDGTFLESFYQKGRFTELMENIPVFVILNSETSLYGSALVAACALNPGARLRLAAAER